MKYFLLGIIRLYWLIPKKHRRHCIFKESCSNYVYRKTNEEGLIVGFKSLQDRFKKCRPGYALYKAEDGITYVILADKSVVKREETVI